MKALKKTGIWYQALKTVTSMVLVVATLSVHIPCDGFYYQPVVPERLRCK